VIGFHKWRVSRRLEKESRKTQTKDDDKLQKALDAVETDPTNIKDKPTKSSTRDKVLVLDYRGVRSISTGYTKTGYYRFHPKIIFAIENASKLKLQNQENDDFISKDYYKEGNKIVVIIGKGNSKGTVKISQAAIPLIKEWEFLSKTEEVAKKKKTVGGEDARQAIVKLVGNALILGGPTALAGIIVNGTMGAIKSGFSFARFVNRMIDNRKGRYIGYALKYKGKMTGVDKSARRKYREYVNHAQFIMKMVEKLPTMDKITTNKNDNDKLKKYRRQFERVHKYIRLTGVDTAELYTTRGDPNLAIQLIVNSLKER
jgi:hypothetical protein